MILKTEKKYYLSQICFGPRVNCFLFHLLKTEKYWWKQDSLICSLIWWAHQLSKTNFCSQIVWRNNTLFTPFVLGSSSIWTCWILNFEYQIFVVVYYRQAQWKKSKQIYKIRHFQIDALPRTFHTVILLDRTFKKWVLSSFAFQSF